MAECLPYKIGSVHDTISLQDCHETQVGLHQTFQKSFLSFMKRQAHKEPDQTNSMMSRGMPVIVLGPTGNLQGTYKLLSLTTGKKIINITDRIHQIRVHHIGSWRT
jgi:hypothetical protein